MIAVEGEGRLFPEEEFVLFFPTFGDAAAKLVQRQTDRLAVLPDHLHDVRREVRQLKRPGSEGTVHLVIFGDFPYGRHPAGNEFRHALMRLYQRGVDGETRRVPGVRGLHTHPSGIPVQFARHCQDALHAGILRRDAEVQSRLFQQFDDAFGVEQDPDLVFEDLHPPDQRMDDVVFLHGEHRAPYGRETVQRLSRLFGVEDITQFPLADVRQHGRSLQQDGDPVQQQFFQRFRRDAVERTLPMCPLFVHMTDVILIPPSVGLGRRGDEHRRVAVAAVDDPGKRFQRLAGLLVPVFARLEGRLHLFPEVRRDDAFLLALVNRAAIPQFADVDRVLEDLADDLAAQRSAVVPDAFLRHPLPPLDALRFQQPLHLLR